MSKKPVVGIVLGSKSDEPKIKKCCDVLDWYGIPFELNVISAHRMPRKTAKYAQSAAGRGLKVLIAGAGLAAALPGTLAAQSLLPVVGLPLASGALNGVDALYASVQMPPGVPVAVVGIDNAANAGHLAAQILSLSQKTLLKKIEAFRSSFGDDRSG